MSAVNIGRGVFRQPRPVRHGVTLPNVDKIVDQSFARARLIDETAFATSSTGLLYRQAKKEGNRFIFALFVSRSGYVLVDAHHIRSSLADILLLSERIGLRVKDLRCRLGAW